MSLFNIANPFFNSSNNKNALSEINTGDFTYTKCRTFNNETKYVFHVNLIKLLDKLFLSNCYASVTPKQEAMIRKYAEEAGIATDKLNDSVEDFRDEMQLIFLQLDDFLGGYIGENSGKYKR